VTAQPVELPACKGAATAAIDDELVVLWGVPFAARCAAHELPFFGVAHVGYMPGARTLDAADLADALERLTQAPQRQERLTAAVSEWIDAALDPRGLGVVLEAEHTCHAGRGAGGRGANVVTARLRGVLKTDAWLRAEFVGRCVRRRPRAVRAAG
jgi:GTP cyclohydrolase I